MNITETTVKPTPPPRTFSIEFTENQLMNLGLALGNIIPTEMRKSVENNDWRAQVFPGIVYEDNLLYDKILNALKPKP